MDIRTLKLSDLNPAKYNPRKELKPGDTEFEKLKRSIESFGYVELIVVNEATGFTVISGHQRLSVLKALGYDSVECIVVSLLAVRVRRSLPVSSLTEPATAWSWTLTTATSS